MNILIVGHTGQLGSELVKSALGFHGLVTVNRPSIFKEYLNEIKNKVEMEKPDLIINASAWTNVESAENNYDKAYLANAELPKQLARIAKKHQILFTQISTDYVFSGDKDTPWETYDTRNPVNSYGLTKAIGEDFVLDEYSENSQIIRTSWLYSENGNNFVKKILYKLFYTSDLINVVSDQTGQPTNVKDLAKQILVICEKLSTPGIFHLTNEGQTTWYNFAQAISRYSGNDPSRIVPIESSHLKSKVKRPMYSVLSKKCWEGTDFGDMQDWGISLKRDIGFIFEAVVKNQKYDF